MRKKVMKSKCLVDVKSKKINDRPYRRGYSHGYEEAIRNFEDFGIIRTIAQAQKIYDWSVKDDSGEIILPPALKNKIMMGKI